MKKIDINFENGTVNGQPFDDLYTLLYTALEKEYAVYVTAKIVPARLRRAGRYSVFANKNLTLNGEQIQEYAQLNKYCQAILDYFYDKEMKEESKEVLAIITADRELFRHYKQGTLVDFLHGTIKDSGYDVSLSSERQNDKTCVTYYKGETYTYDYTRHSKGAETTLLDLLKMYQNIKFYQQAGFLPDRKTEREEELVLPVSACDLTTQSWFA